ncbi:MAG: hypothetical protein ACU0A6_17820 [Shimia sp.]
MSIKFAFALSFACLPALSACSSNTDLPVRTVPQAEHPVTGKSS